MMKNLVFLATLGVALADYDAWAPVDATVTQVVSRTAYVCPCDGSTSYGPNWNVWEGQMSGVVGSGTKTAPTPKTDGNPFPHPGPTGYSTLCYTRLGSSSALYGTSWSTSYTPCTSTITSTVNTTTTLPASTSIISTTVTTTVTGPASTNTGTATVTTTITDTITSTVTDTSTTSTISTSTSTVAAPSGFVPVQSSLPGSSNNSSGGALPPAKRDEDIEFGTRDTSDYNQKSPMGGFEYPNGVDCIHWTTSQCSSVSTTVTSTHTVSASSVTSTQTITSTFSVFPPNVTTTVTTTSTATFTDINLEITTTTTTSTSIVPGPTFYAECARNNFADNVNGTIIGNLQDTGEGQSGVTTMTTSTEYDCCVAGVLLASSAVSLFAPSLSPNCYIATQFNCTAGQGTTTYKPLLGDRRYGPITVSNLGCAEIALTS